MVAETVVIDASVAAKWFLLEEDWEAAEALLNNGNRLIAPDLVLAEVLNTYWKYVEKGSKPALTIREVADLLLRSFGDLVSTIDLAASAAEIAVDLHHPIYDCFYLALAEREGMGLVTADERLYRKTRRTRFSSVVRKLT
jgi:predicted nucleic acid-binding protein